MKRLPLLFISLSFFILFGCTSDRTSDCLFSMSCKVTACNGELSTHEGRQRLVSWCQRYHVGRLWLESYRHGERVSSDLLYTLARQLAGAEVISVHKDTDDISTHTFRKHGRALVIHFNRRTLSCSQD